MRVTAALLALLVASQARAEDRVFGADKALHFSASAGIAAVAYTGSALVHSPVEARLTAAIGFALFAGVGKELLDTQLRGDPSALDLAWDLVGAVTGTALAWIIDCLFFDRPLTPALSPTEGRERRGSGGR